MTALRNDLRYAFRMLGRAPVFTAVAILSLALGIGANSAIFAFVDAILLKTLPVSHPERLVLLRSRHRVLGLNEAFGYPFFREIERRNDVFSSATAWFPIHVNLGAGGSTERHQAELVSGGYFQTLGIRPVVGRLLVPEDDGAESAHPVCVISYELWQNRFGGDPNALSKSVTLDTHPFQIVGVTEPAYRGAELESRYDLQIPMSMAKLFMNVERDSKNFWWLQIMGRLRSGVSIQQAQASVDSLARHIDAESGRKDSTYLLEDGRQGFGFLRGELRSPLLVLVALSSMVLLIACANLANLLVARAAERRREIAIRQSLGGTRGRLIRQLLVESLLLALMGGVCGLLLAALLNRTLAAMLFSPGTAIDVKQNGLVIAFTFVLSLVTGIVFGLAPAFEATRPELLPALKEALHTGTGLGRAWLRRTLIAVQIAVCLILVFGAGLFARTLRNLRTIDLGFRTDRIVLLSMDMEKSGYKEADSLAFFTELLRRVRQIPGVEAAALADISVLSRHMSAMGVEVPGYTSRGEIESNNNFNTVSENYFQTLRIPLLRGRDFEARDSRGAPPVAIVNQRFVDYYWPGQNPIGRHFGFNGKNMEIIGLVKTAKYMTVREEPQITIYLPLAQQSASELTLHVRTSMDPAGIITRLREQVRAIDAKLPVYNVTTLSQQMNERISTERVLSLLSSMFGVLAVLVAAAGLYGIIAYAVVRRTREIGIRMAVGARGRDVIRLFVSETIALAGIGIAAGVPLALAAARLLRSSLYGVKHDDALTLIGAGGILLSVALAAVLIPARKAARIDPAAALRYE
jgi:predicted permease